MNILPLLPFWILLGAMSAYCAFRRGRSPMAWFGIGLFIGIFSFLLLFLLPRKERPVLMEESIEPCTPLLIPKNPDLDRPWFYIDLQKQQRGPLYFKELFEAWKRGHFTKNSLVWCEGMNEWKKTEDIPDLLLELTSL